MKIRFTAIVLPAVVAIISLGSMCNRHSMSGPVKVLILSGRNNHNWQETTPVLVKMFTGAGFPEPAVTNLPDTLGYEDFRKFDVVISNWNSFPDSKFRMDSLWEQGFLRFVREGGGVITFHAGGSSFYEWAPYHRITIGRWGAGTSHGSPTAGRVYNLSRDHPVTRGMTEFLITDELWEGTEIHEGAKAIGFLSFKNATDGHQVTEPAIFWRQEEKGRVFYTILGHDETALLNPGFRVMILRAAQWCAGKKVNIPAPE